MNSACTDELPFSNAKRNVSLILGKVSLQRIKE